MNRVLLPFCIALVLQALSLQGASVVEPGAKVSKLAGGMKFTEGPVWLPQQNKVVFSDIPNSKLMQWSEKNGLSVFRKSEQANGNILDLQGRIIFGMNELVLTWIEEESMPETLCDGEHD